MNLAFLLSKPGRTARSVRMIALSAAMLALSAGVHAAYQGPVPAPADAFGAPGPYAVATETFPSPDWPDHVVTVFRPEGAEGKRPVWFFAHGFAGSDPEFYGELLRHLASHGAMVVFSPYPAALLDVAGNYNTLFDGFTAAVARYPDLIDTTRVGFAGHSYGGGAVPALALRAMREHGWGAQGLALLMLAPWYSYFVSDTDLASFPAGTEAVVQVYEDDSMNDHRMAVDVFTHLNLPVANKDFLMVHSDRIEGYDYTASHRVPTGASTPGDDAAFNALDAWGVLRIAAALGASTFDHDSAGRAVALGNGAPEQTQMGQTPGGRALRPMTETDAPVALFPSTRYLQRWDLPLNPRRNEALPAPAVRPHLANLSARGWSGSGDEVLIAGAVLDGSRPKSLLVRAVGPGLVAQGVPAAMPDPRLVTFRDAGPDITLNDWSETPEPDVLAAAEDETGAFALADGSRDAALLASFAPGVLTAHVIPADGAPGVALAEFYDADDDAAATMTNLSARAKVGTGDAVLIAGFVVSGPGPVQVLIRGVGPALAGFGVESPLPDPQLVVLHDGETIAANDNWSNDPAQAETIAAAASRAGAFPLAAGSADASLLLTLEPGAYTAHVTAAGGATGIGLAEVYLVP